MCTLHCFLPLAKVSERVHWSSRLLRARHTYACYDGGAGLATLPDRTNVAIVGAGPVGLTMSLYLSKYGIPHVILERRQALTQHPQAHLINNRTMEVFRPLDGLADEVASRTPPLPLWRKFVYCESMTGEVFGQVDHFPGQTTPQLPVSPVPVAHLPQNRLLPLMMRRVLDGGLAHVFMGTEVSRFSQSPGGVELSYHCKLSGQINNRLSPSSVGTQGASSSGSSSSSFSNSSQDWTSSSGSSSSSYSEYGSSSDPHRSKHGSISSKPLYGGSSSNSSRSQSVHGSSNSSVGSLHADYVVAADGAHSPIRQALGIAMKGNPGLQHLMNVHFRSRRLADLARQRPAMLYFVYGSKAIVVMVAHDIVAGEFVAQVPYFPPFQSPSEFTKPVCKQIIEAAAGCEVDVDIAEVRPWVMSAEVADRFQDGRIFLVGDSAHRFPPAGGFGMNTGIQDAHNLAWKLAAVIKGMAGPELLDTYESERCPVAWANTNLSVDNWREALKVPQTLGLDPHAADMLVNTLAAVPLPQTASRAILDLGLSIGRTLSGTRPVLGPLAAWRKRALGHLMDSGSTLRLQFPAEDLGFRYPPASSACAAQTGSDHVISAGTQTQAQASGIFQDWFWPDSSSTSDSLRQARGMGTTFGNEVKHASTHNDTKVRGAAVVYGAASAHVGTGTPRSSSSMQPTAQPGAVALSSASMSSTSATRGALPDLASPSTQVQERTRGGPYIPNCAPGYRLPHCYLHVGDREWQSFAHNISAQTPSDAGSGHKQGLEQSRLPSRCDADESSQRTSSVDSQSGPASNGKHAQSSPADDGKDSQTGPTDTRTYTQKEIQKVSTLDIVAATGLNLLLVWHAQSASVQLPTAAHISLTAFVQNLEGIQRSQPASAQIPGVHVQNSQGHVPDIQNLQTRDVWYEAVLKLLDESLPLKAVRVVDIPSTTSGVAHSEQMSTQGDLHIEAVRLADSPQSMSVLHIDHSTATQIIQTHHNHSLSRLMTAHASRQSWTSSMGLPTSANCLLLVRPDGHVAWRGVVDVHSIQTQSSFDAAVQAVVNAVRHAARRVYHVP